MLAQRSQFHQERLAANASLGDINFTTALNGATQAAQLVAGRGPADALQVGLAQIYRLVQSQAAMLAYLDVYYVGMILAAVMFVLSWFLRANRPQKGVAVAAH